MKPNNANNGLTEFDVRGLGASGISRDLAITAGIRRVDCYEGATLVGREKQGYSGDYDGLWFPNNSPFAGECGGRLRRDRPDIEDGKPRNKYLTAPGEKGRLYFVPGQSVEELKDASRPIVLFEGEKKGLAGHEVACHRSEHPRFIAIAMSGVWNWRGKTGKTTGPNGETLNVTGVIPDFDQIEFKGRDVRVCLDSDRRSNGHVAAAGRALSKELRKRKANVRYFDLPEDAGVKGFDDWVGAAGLDAVLEALEASADDPGELPGKFMVQNDWLVYAGNEGPQLVCTRLDVLGQCRSFDSDNWGKVLTWHDPAGRKHEWVLPNEMLSGDGREYRQHLLHRGVHIDPSREAQKLLGIYLSASSNEKLIHTAGRVGWDQEVKRFVLPNKTVSADKSDRIIFQGTIEHLYKESGSIEDWRKNVADLCSGNTRLITAVSAAFVPPLLRLLGEESGGIHFVGASSLGKSTTLAAAGSVWGGGGPLGFVRNWRATANGLEATAELHNDALLAMDELSQLNPSDAADAAYMLANGSGKSRMTKNCDSRAVKTWRLIFLSCGELTLSEHSGAAGKSTKAGTEVRMLNIPADAGARLGLFENLHGAKSAGEFANTIKRNSLNHYGTAAPAFLEWLVRNRESAIDRARTRQRAFVSRNASGANGEVLRAASRMGLLVAAGLLAREAGVVRWSADDVELSITRCFNDWVGQRGVKKDQASDLEHAIGRVRGFIEANGASRFQKIEKAKTYAGVTEFAPRDLVINRAGYLKKLKGEWVYLIFRNTFRDEVCRGASYLPLAGELKRRGLLITDGDTLMAKRTVPGESEGWFYAVKDSIMSAGDDAPETEDDVVELAS